MSYDWQPKELEFGRIKQRQAQIYTLRRLGNRLLIETASSPLKRRITAHGSN